MRYIGAKLDVDAIDKVHVLNELRRFLMFLASQAACQIWTLLQPKIPEEIQESVTN